MEDDRLYRDPALAQFYDLDNGWAPDLDYCRHLAEDAESVLDLGCGTGLFAARMAEGRRVVGVDPAAAMLEIARSRPGGRAVEWLEADARSLRLEERFDLIVMTGHAFQVFLEERNQRAVLATIAYHLAHHGRFIFDSRNPAAEEWHDWTPERSRRQLEHPTLGPVEAWNEAEFDPGSGIVTYWTHYRVTASGDLLSAESHIRFTPQKTLAALLDDAGLAVDTWLGDWQGNPYTPTSPDIIPIGRLL